MTTLKEAIKALDTAITGRSDCHSSHPSTLEEWLDKGEIYLSDGGYTRILLDWEDVGGEVGLLLRQTGTTSRREAWKQASKEKAAVIAALRPRLISEGYLPSGVSNE